MPEPNQTAEEIFYAARTVEAGAERSAFLDRACGGDADLRAEVEGLLRADADAGSFLAHDGGAPDSPPRQASPAQWSVETPHPIVGRYKLLQQIGEGGFGLVYLAEQTEPVIRRVALKIIKRGMDTRQVIARFEAERQALALMDHPNIARVLDAGETPDGRPFFVMELVRGEPITAWCDAHNFDLDARLDLFVQVCQTVQHAHQKGVIHRDLKPSNVLVAVADNRPVPKVIDFGIAKATRMRLTEKTLFTEMQQLIGTPQYMSPEQAEAGGVDVDTRSDVYSLGVLLYELLTGTTPFDPQRLRSAAFGEIQRIIREEEPPKPSTRLSTLDSLPSVAAHRRAEPRRLGTLVRGDLDWIVMKCLEKDRGRRYETADALVTDIRRHRRHEPVLAGPPGAGYRVRKFVRRHRAAVVAGSALAASLMLGIVGTSAGLSWALREKSRAQENEQRAVDEADRAEREAARAHAAETDATQRADDLERVAAFQESQLAEIDAATMGVRLRRYLLARKREALTYAIGEDPEVEQRLAELEAALAGINFTNVALTALDENIFEQALKAIEEQFPDQPLLKARLLQTVADTMREVGLFKTALAPQTEALDIRERLLHDEHPDTLRSVGNMGGLLMEQGRYEIAEPYLARAAEVWRRVAGDEHPETLRAINNLAGVLAYQGKFSQAGAHLSEVAELRRRLLGDDHPDTLRSVCSLGGLLLSQGRFADAEVHLRAAVEGCRRVLGNDHADTLAAMSTLGSLLRAQGRLVDAEPLFRDALAASRRMHGDDHPDTTMLVNNLGGVLRASGKLDEAEPYYLEALASTRKTLGEEHLDTLIALGNMGSLLQAQGRLDEAEVHFRDALAKMRRVLGDEHPSTLMSVSNLGVLHMVQGRVEDAEPYLREAMEGRRKIIGEAHPNTLMSKYNWGSLLHRQSRYAESEELLLTTYDAVDSTLPRSHVLHRIVPQLLSRVYESWHAAEPDRGYDLKADLWRQRAGESAPSQ